MKKIKELKEVQIQKIIFIVSFIICLLLGLSLSYNFDFTKNFNLLFGSDTARVIRDIADFSVTHDRLTVHPLFVLFTEPVYNIINAIVLNKMLALVIISSLVTSLTVLFIYKILSLYSSNKLIKILLITSYLFTFSNYIFTAGIEVYNIATLFLVLIWYYTLKKYKENKYSTSSYIILTVLGILSFSFTITNIAVFFIILFLFLISKKIKFKYLLIIIFFTIFISFDLVNFQNVIWHNTPIIGFNNLNKENEYINYKIKPSNVTNVIKNDYLYSLIGNNIHLESIKGQAYVGDNYTITFNDNNNLFIICLTSIFYILSLILLIRNYKTNKFINIGLILTILFNTILHTLYGNDNPFLYSLHFVYLFYLSFGINISNEKNKTIINICKIYLIILLLSQLMINNIIFVKILNIVKTILPCNFYVANFDLFPVIFMSIFVIITIGIIIYFIIRIINKFKKAKKQDDKLKYGIIAVFLVIIVQSIFISLEANKNSNTIIWKKIDSNSENIYIDTNKYLSKDNYNFKKKFAKEIKELNNYQKEYKQLLKDYNAKKVTFLNGSNYYFFGLGNRRKLLFKNDSLIDIESGNKIFTWNVLNSVVIPNIYTVLIETSENKYIKLYEDDDGVHYVNNDIDTIIENTDKKINLYTFENQKYKNTKKVLYSEILFNIKDSKIYPNIIVYDYPWYRDAAMASMVLKATNNTDLISDWVNSITDIYDKQNKGIKEPDNLGELLYIISTQDNPNHELINKIEDEANLLAKNNASGYFITGQTDFSAKPLYQNLWYQCGTNNLGKDFSFSIDNLNDEYGILTWWMDNKVSNKKYTADDNFPYLSIASFHKTRKGKFPLNNSIYPLSWERNASEANYSKMQVLDDYYTVNRLSPLHTWTASELLLLLMDEDHKLNICYNR